MGGKSRGLLESLCWTGLQEGSAPLLPGPHGPLPCLDKAVKDRLPVRRMAARGAGGEKEGKEPGREWREKEVCGVEGPRRVCPALRGGQVQPPHPRDSLSPEPLLSLLPPILHTSILNSLSSTHLQPEYRDHFIIFKSSPTPEYVY